MCKPIRIVVSLTFIGIFISLLAGFGAFKSYSRSHSVPIASQPVTELAVDDGTFEATFGRTDGALSWRVNRLTPASYPATINAVCHYLRQRENTDV